MCRHGDQRGAEHGDQSKPEQSRRDEMLTTDQSREEQSKEEQSREERAERLPHEIQRMGAEPFDRPVGRFIGRISAALFGIPS
jgi:hypothetical protein